jgi:hypothetical protein
METAAFSMEYRMPEGLNLIEKIFFLSWKTTSSHWSSLRSVLCTLRQYFGGGSRRKYRDQESEKKQ